MRKIKELKQNIEFYDRELRSTKYDLDKAVDRIALLLKKLENQEKETEKYKILYLQMLETNLILAEKVGVTSE